MTEEASAQVASQGPLKVVNESFCVSAYSGGAEKPELSIDNVLQPTLRPYHCSGPGVSHSLDLKLREDASSRCVVLTHVVIHGAPGCSERVKSGSIWLGESAECTNSEPTLVFETDSVKSQWCGNLAAPTPVKFVRILFSTTHGQGENIDIGMVALVGVDLAASDTAPEDLKAHCAASVPASLGLLDLLKVKKRKRWLPLESNPKVVSKYLKKLGMEGGEVHELLSFEAWALDMVPRPCSAVFLLFPTGKETDAARKERNSEFPAPPANVVHMKQLVGNACGTIAAVHVMANLCRHKGAAPSENSWLERFLLNYREGMTSDDVGQLLEEDAAIEAAHAEAEKESEAANHSRANKNLHFICFVDVDGLVLEMDGCNDGPVVRARVADFGNDFLAAAAAVILERYVNVSPDALRFNAMALSSGGAALADGDFGALVAATGFISDEAISQLEALGFDKESARNALEASGGNVETAANMLLGVG
eukprot:TRINITY_DN90224_c0_g1_i1.p1 TRINITY_DN90224_c0_g1~~TRINITY_DN90224_c0_g1_i1.p1  ORF type:complete len:480 (-),score=91.47 TRINITY_DN90224_c0_g1_i1:275-1714(-)